MAPLAAQKTFEFAIIGAQKECVANNYILDAGISYAFGIYICRKSDYFHEK